VILLALLLAAAPLDRAELAKGPPPPAERVPAALAKLKHAPEEGFTLEVHQGPGDVLYSHYEMPMGTQDAAWLGGTPIAEWSNNEAGEVSEEATLGDGVITVKRTVKPALHDLEGELVVVGTATHRVSKGKVTRGTFTYASNDGRYIDAKSKEQLTLRDGKAWYQGNADKPPQELVVEGDAKSAAFNVRFKKEKKPYQLKLDAARTKLECTNPDGTKQTFERAWYAR
jgi:hypothetical protein